MAPPELPDRARQAPRIDIELPSAETDKEYGGTRIVAQGYETEQGKIGQGTYGSVFRGKCRETGQKVALKRIAIDSSEGFPIYAIREIRILSSLRHDNIVNLREIVRDPASSDGQAYAWDPMRIYLVFDYAPSDLTGYMADYKYGLPEEKAKCILSQILKGLAYAHSQGVMHRDMKASNILLDEKGTVKLADFGLARAQPVKEDEPLTNNVITRWYRPPELLLGAVNYGPAVDMWSVGCVMVELLIGKAIFPGQSEPDQIDRIFQMLGTPTEQSWPGVEKLLDWHCVPKRKYPQGMGLRKWLQDCVNKMPSKTEADKEAKQAKQAMLHSGAIELLEKMLQLDPQKRITALDAFQDAWLVEQQPYACMPSELGLKNPKHEYAVRKQLEAEEKQRQAQQRQQSYPQQRPHGGQYNYHHNHNQPHQQAQHNQPQPHQPHNGHQSRQPPPHNPPTQQQYQAYHNQPRQNQPHHNQPPHQQPRQQHNGAQNGTHGSGYGPYADGAQANKRLCVGPGGAYAPVAYSAALAAAAASTAQASYAPGGYGSRAGLPPGVPRNAGHTNTQQQPQQRPPLQHGNIHQQQGGSGRGRAQGPPATRPPLAPQRVGGNGGRGPGAAGRGGPVGGTGRGGGRA